MSRSLVVRAGVGRLPVALAIIGVGMFGGGAVATATSPAASPAVASPAVSASDPGVLSHCRELNNHPILRRGDTGLYVGHAQCLLKHHWNQRIDVDRIFGPATEGAVRNVQRWCGLVEDGDVGSNTWRVLHRHGTC